MSKISMKKYSLSLVYGGLLLIIGIAVSLLAWGYSEHMFSELINKPESSFNRAGCLLVLFSVFAEFQLNNATVPMGADVGDIPSNLNCHNRLVSCGKWVSHIFIIIGTIIWGYGDLIHINLSVS